MKSFKQLEDDELDELRADAEMFDRVLARAKEDFHVNVGNWRRAHENYASALFYKKRPHLKPWKQYL